MLWCFKFYLPRRSKWATKQNMSKLEMLLYYDRLTQFRRTDEGTWGRIEAWKLKNLQSQRSLSSVMSPVNLNFSSPIRGITRQDQTSDWNEIGDTSILSREVITMYYVLVFNLILKKYSLTPTDDRSSLQQTKLQSFLTSFNGHLFNLESLSKCRKFNKIKL